MSKVLVSMTLCNKKSSVSIDPKLHSGYQTAKKGDKGHICPTLGSFENMQKY